MSLLRDIESFRAASNAIFGGSGGGETPFQDWRHTAQLYRTALMEEKQAVDAVIAANQDEFSQKKARELNDALVKEYDSLVLSVKRELRKSLEKARESTVQRVQAISNAVPDEEMLRILELFSKRESLSAEELAYAAEKMKSCYPALRLLSEMGKRSNVLFPAIPGEGEMLQKIDECVELCEKQLESIGEKSLSLSTLSYIFYNSEAGYRSLAAVDEMGGAINLQQQEATETAGIEYQATDSTGDDGRTLYAEFVSCGESLDELAAAFHVRPEDILSVNPGISAGGLRSGQKVYIPSTHCRVGTGKGCVNPNQILRLVEFLEPGEEPEPPGREVELTANMPKKSGKEKK